MNHARKYMDEVVRVAGSIDASRIDTLALCLADVRRRRGRLFLAGLGGSSANCSHAAADLRKLCSLNAVSLMDSVADYSARVNDNGPTSVFEGMLEDADATGMDALMILSVGGGAPGVSEALIRAVDFAQRNGMQVFGVVGRDGGYTLQHGDCVIVVPPVSPTRVTPHTEAFHMVVLHCLVSHPDLQRRATKW